MNYLYYYKSNYYPLPTEFIFLTIFCNSSKGFDIFDIECITTSNKYISNTPKTK